MSVYLLLWGSVVITGMTLSQLDRRVNHLLFKFTCLLLTFFIGLRHEVGGDWWNYQYIYAQISQISWLQSLVYTDPGYGLSNWWANQLGLSIHAVNFFCALIFMWGVGRFCLSLPQPWFALLIAIPYLVSAVAMGYTRQSAAIGFFLLGLVQLLDKKTWMFVFFILMGVLFHKSVAVMLILVPLTRPQQKYGQLFFIWSFVAVVALICLFLMMERFAGMWNLYIVKGMKSDGGLARALLNLVPAVCFLITREKWKYRWPRYYILLFWMSIAALFLFPLQFFISTAVDRLSLYLVPLQMMVFSSLPLLFSSAQRYVVITATLVFYSVVYSAWLFFSYWAQCCWIPYNNILLQL